MNIPYEVVHDLKHKSVYKNEGAYVLHEGAHALMLEIMHDLKHEGMYILTEGK